ncbi:MAG: hypothetical protein AB7K24_28110 [Gemmataceae bacterium]
MNQDVLNQPAPGFCAANELMLTAAGEEALRPGLTVRAYFHELMQHENYADARRVLAHALPKRRALWWGLLCAWEAVRPCPPENVQEVLRAVARFVMEPGEEKRRQVEAISKLVRFESMANQLAQAAFLSTGSMTAPDLPEVFPQPFLTGRLVGVTVYLSSVLREPARYQQRLKEYIAVGLEVARVDQPWRVLAPFEHAPVLESAGAGLAALAL